MAGQPATKPQTETEEQELIQKLPGRKPLTAHWLPMSQIEENPPLTTILLCRHDSLPQMTGAQALGMSRPERGLSSLLRLFFRIVSICVKKDHLRHNCFT